MRGPFAQVANFKIIGVNAYISGQGSDLMCFNQSSASTLFVAGAFGTVTYIHPDKPKCETLETNMSLVATQSKHKLPATVEEVA